MAMTDISTLKLTGPVTLSQTLFTDKVSDGFDVTPTGNTLIDGKTGTQLKGTDGNDRATLSSLYHDKDGVINLGAGDDTFVFGNGDKDASLNGKAFNGVVQMGEGGNDQVFLTHSVNDYEFSLRSDGGIKITYIGTDASGDHGAAVTFYGADNFVFRNIDDTGHNFDNTNFTHDALFNAIAAQYPTV